MTRTANIVHATVKYTAGKPRTTSDGRQRVNVVVTLPNGDEERLWGDPGDPITELKKGQSVTLIYDGKGYALAVDTPAPGKEPGAIAPSQTPPQPAVEPTSPDVAEWVSIFKELRAALPEQSEQLWRAAASTIYMQRHRSSIQDLDSL